MATPSLPAHRQLADALADLKRLHDSGRNVFASADFGRLQREALLRAGFIRPVVQGWYRTSTPTEADGETTSWYATAGEFVAAYCESRFQADWCVSDEHSVRLHAGDTALPRTVVVQAPAGTNTVLQLPVQHTLLDYRARSFPSAEQRTVVQGLRAMTLERALVGVQERFFRSFPCEAQVALMSLKDPGGLLRELLEGSRPVVAGRLAGAMRACGLRAFADEIVTSMRRAGHNVTEADPFEAAPPSLRIVRGEAPHATRLRHMWAAMREDVMNAFPPEPGCVADPSYVEGYLAGVRDIYVLDAYHSLSIEGYKVTEGLIARVADGGWNPDKDTQDGERRDAMAARGYFLARAAVEESIRRMLEGEEPGTVLHGDHRGWFRELFAPSVDAGILKPSHLAGYRGHQVYIRNATHVPPSPHAVRDMMPAMFELLSEEPSAAVRAVMGHLAFVYIHPYMDGNGRMARFLMNTMFASGGYPWTLIEVQRRADYMQALEAASAGGDIKPFAAFVASCMAKTPTPLPR